MGHYYPISATHLKRVKSSKAIQKIEGVIITACIPDKRMWTLNKRRRIRKK